MPQQRNPVTLCIFAHPDDEAFGPSGAIATFAQSHDVYLLCVTNGNDPGVEADLTQIRQQELRRSADTLGIKKVFFLDYPDGGLCNSVYHEVADKIEALAIQLQVTRFLTFEPRGVSGHLDHIALAMISNFVFEKIGSVTELWHFCLSVAERALLDNYFIYFPPGYKAAAVDRILDVSQVWEKKVAAIECHQSQKNDAERVLWMKNQLPKEEYFLVRQKNKK